MCARKEKLNAGEFGLADPRPLSQTGPRLSRQNMTGLLNSLHQGDQICALGAQTFQRQVYGFP